jgi:hypothetical protein
LEDKDDSPVAKSARIDEEHEFVLGRLRHNGRPTDTPALALFDPTRPSRAVFTFYFLIGLTDPLQVCLERTGLVSRPPPPPLPPSFNKKTTMVIEEDELPADDSEYVLYAEDKNHDGESSASGSGGVSSSDDHDSSSDALDEEDILAAANVDAGDSGHDEDALFSVYATSEEEKQHLASFLARYEPSPTGFVNLMVGVLLYLAGADDPLLVERFAKEFPLLPGTPVAGLKLLTNIHHTPNVASASFTILHAGIAEEEEDDSI